MQEYKMDRRDFLHLGKCVVIPLAVGTGIAAGIYYLGSKRPKDYQIELVPITVGTYGVDNNASVWSLVKAQHLPGDVDIRDWVQYTIDENRKRNPKFNTNLHPGDTLYVPKLKEIKPSLKFKEPEVIKRSSSRKE